MKQILFFLIMTIFSINVFSQKLNCGCNKKKIISENQYKCDTITFNNGAMIYWQWNCDSARLIFENKKKYILRKCKKMNVYECERTGLNYLKEYPNYLLFQYNWISGCCISPDIVFISKINGKEIKRIKTDQFIWGNLDENYVLYFSDTTYKKLIYLDNNSDKQYSIQFEKGKVMNSTNKNNVLQLSDLFKNFKKNDTNFTFDFKTASGKIEKLTIQIK